MSKPYRAGGTIEDVCRACKTDRLHTVMAVDGEGRPIRVVCDYCRSEHNFRGGPRMEARPVGDPVPLVSQRERTASPMPVDAGQDLELLLRRIIREEAGVTAVTPADKWRGGAFVLKPARAGVQEKSWPIETFFHKVVMLRNRLRTLEQHVNGSDLPEDAKVKLQAYITGCYGSLTSFNVLFADDEDRFVGSGGD